MTIDITPLSRDYRVAMRDKFACQYCGHHKEETGSMDRLTVVHIIPKRLGGTDNDANKVTACVGCAEKKGDQPFYPGVDYSSKDGDGWHTWRTFGRWSMRVDPDDGSTCCVVHDIYYWFDILHCWRGNEINEPNPWGWERQISKKCWCRRDGDSEPCSRRSASRARAREKLGKSNDPWIGIDLNELLAGGPSVTGEVEPIERDPCSVIDIEGLMAALDLARSMVTRPTLKAPRR